MTCMQLCKQASHCISYFCIINTKPHLSAVNYVYIKSGLLRAKCIIFWTTKITSYTVCMTQLCLTICYSDLRHHSSYIHNTYTPHWLQVYVNLCCLQRLEFQHLWGQDGCVFDDQMNNSRNYYGQVVITQFQGELTISAATGSTTVLRCYLFKA